MTGRTILVTGATGSQGGATLRNLIDRATGDTLLAMVRNPESEKAKALVKSGVQLVRGDLDDEASLRQALKGVNSVYSVQTMIGNGLASEESQGKRLATLAAEAGVEHFVYSSVAGAERQSGVPHFESKWAIEEHIRSLRLPHTIIRPVMFMDNLQEFRFRTMILSMMKSLIPADRPIQLIATSDIGWFAADALAKPEAYLGKEIEIAGDELTRPEIQKALSESGKGPALAFRMPGFMLSRIPEDFTLMMKWIGRAGFSADIASLRSTHPGLLDLRSWASNR